MKCISLITISILMIHSCKTIETYNQRDSPKFHNNSIIENSPHNNLLKVISFNIKNGTDPTYVITELKNSNNFSDPNILLLQEVDEETVIQIADSFHLNYLYYPIACSNKNLNFGNAILSNSTITEASKLILPHSKSNGRIRNATNGVVEFKGHKILVYSIHNETIVMGAKKRMEQLDFIIEDIKKRSDQYHAIIVGGDFNTITKMSLDNTLKVFNDLGFIWTNRQTGSTSKGLANTLNFKLDHIFIKNLEVINTIKILENTNSDHMPLMTLLKID